jgi:hypothetical protein
MIDKAGMIVRKFLVKAKKGHPVSGMAFLST